MTQSEATAGSSLIAKRISLFILHLLLLIGLLASIPSGYAYQMGYQTGGPLIFTTFALWVAFFLASSRKNFIWCSVAALVQVGLLGLLVLHDRAEDRVLQQVSAELLQKRKDLEAEMRQYNLDALFEMCSGKRALSDADLRELHARAKAAKAKVSAVPSETARWNDEAEAKIARVSPQGARDFRRGLEVGSPEEEELVRLTGSFYGEVERLTAFLIEREQHYRMTSTGLVFDKDEDAQWFNQRMQTIQQLQAQMSTKIKKVQEQVR